MQRTKAKLLNIEIDDISVESFLERFTEGLVITPNVDHMIQLQKDREFRDIYESADWVVCDSTILSLSLFILGTPIQCVIPGSDLLPLYYNYHRNNPEVRIFLLGAAPGIARKAMENINRKVRREIVVGALSPSFGFENNSEECEQIVETVNRSGATVLVVGVGAPKQEKWINRFRERLPGIRTFMPLGATIDFEAGSLKRAPIVFRNLRAEWLYRLLKEPRRLGRRYLVKDPPFLVLLLRQMLGRYRDPFTSERPSAIQAETSSASMGTTPPTS